LNVGAEKRGDLIGVDASANVSEKSLRDADSLFLAHVLSSHGM
jgi:hypothetical protein